MLSERLFKNGKALHFRILKRTVRKAITRKATPVYQRLKVRKKTMAATIAAGINIQTSLTMRRMIAIPMMTRARKPKNETISTEITEIAVHFIP
jgi:hypothetical protein